MHTFRESIIKAILGGFLGTIFSTPICYILIPVLAYIKNVDFDKWSYIGFSDFWWDIAEGPMPLRFLAISYIGFFAIFMMTPILIFIKSILKK